ncbi:MAG TPA: P-loop NTPase fold protein [Reyranella sp.]|nr:P-loop NTPase fold protein [Reyranella sp.]
MTFISDQETQIDLLYYESIAKTLSKLVRDTPLAPITIGVHGDWGAGKSSVLKMVESDLDQDKGILTVWFNGWAFEGYEDSKAVLIETLLVILMTPDDVDRWLNGASIEEAMAMQKPAPDDALVVGPPMKPEKKAA